MKAGSSQHSPGPLTGFEEVLLLREGKERGRGEKEERGRKGKEKGREKKDGKGKVASWLLGMDAPG